MPIPRAVSEHYRTQQRLTIATLALAQAAWLRMGEDLDASWERIAPVLTVVVTRAQIAAATSGAGYVGETLDELDAPVEPAGNVRPQALAGVASDGRPLGSLLEGAKVHAKESVASGAAVGQALTAGAAWLGMAVQTQVADAARVAAGVAITARPGVGWVRMLNPPSCSRCAVLAGRKYKWNDGFQRHPRCDCRHIPAPEGMADDFRADPQAYFDSLPSASELDERFPGVTVKVRREQGALSQEDVFTKAGAQAIRDGADVSRVVNARRGATGLTPAGKRLTLDEARALRGGRDIGRLQRSDVFGRQVFTTTEAAKGRPRLMPESVYEIATDRDDAVRLLRFHGYIL